MKKKKPSIEAIVDGIGKVQLSEKHIEQMLGHRNLHHKQIWPNKEEAQM